MSAKLLVSKVSRPALMVGHLIRTNASLSDSGRTPKDQGAKVQTKQNPPAPGDQSGAVKKGFKGAKKPFDLTKKSIETPRLDKYSCGLIETVTSIDVSNKLIAWITVNKSGQVAEWNFAEIDSDSQSDDFSPSNSIPSDYKRIWDIYDSKLPKSSSAYLFETRRYKAADVRIVPFLMRIHRSEVILQSIYETKFRLDQQRSRQQPATTAEGAQVDSNASRFQKLYTINSRRVAQSLNILVGNERINSANMVDELVKYKMNKPAATTEDDHQAAEPGPTSDEGAKLALKQRYALDVPVDRMGFYLVKIGAESKFKEAMAKCYLQASCFLNSLRLAASESP